MIPGSIGNIEPVPAQEAAMGMTWLEALMTVEGEAWGPDNAVPSQATGESAVWEPNDVLMRWGDMLRAAGETVVNS